MISDLERLVDSITREKNIPRDVVIEILESAMEAAGRKRFGMTKDIEAQYNEELGEVELFEFRTVVDDVEDEDLEIHLEEAQELDPECLIGDSLGIKMNVEELGRIAAQTAKQVIIQKIRDAERELTFNEFKDRKGELITGIVRRFEKGNIIVDLNRAEAILPRREQVPTETYRPGDRIQAFVLDITRATRQPQVVLSRTHPGLLMKLFEMEVPEIYEGIVRIEACAREPGHRAKIAVSSVDPDVDPVGACVGLKGSRVQAVVAELRGEAIDIIPWHPDPARFIVYAIAPAHVDRVYIDDSTHTMELVVPDDQLAKAIGRRGQNVRLAAQLTGWRIDIYSETKHSQMLDDARKEISRIPDLSDTEVDILVRSGFQSAQELADAEAAEVAGLLDLEDDRATAVIGSADKVVAELIMEEAARRNLPEPVEEEVEEEEPPEAEPDKEELPSESVEDPEEALPSEPVEDPEEALPPEPVEDPEEALPPEPVEDPEEGAGTD
ncbi:MAG: transcription termination/antitermination protein NusA [Deltaproteobacteria bacterium]|nr:transcription termination/antitermination protein NusA [Deltaproteobacteria bacterium]MBW2253378.1 transcription termination/antitermination protein NusA [Deltaproteobacteria bacterium]